MNGELIVEWIGAGAAVVCAMPVLSRFLATASAYVVSFVPTRKKAGEHHRSERGHGSAVCTREMLWLPLPQTIGSEIQIPAHDHRLRRQVERQGFVMKSGDGQMYTMRRNLGDDALCTDPERWKLLLHMNAFPVSQGF